MVVLSIFLHHIFEIGVFITVVYEDIIVGRGAPFDVGRLVLTALCGVRSPEPTCDVHANITVRCNGGLATNFAEDCLNLFFCIP